MMLPNQQIIQAARDNGTFERISRALTLSHVAISVATEVIQDAEEEMRRSGLMLGNIKRLYAPMDRATDRWLKEAARIIRDSSVTPEQEKQSKQLYFRYYEAVDTALRNVFGLPRDWQPLTPEEVAAKKQAEQSGT